MAIADDLRRQITSGDLVAGAVLPSEADLAGSYGVSRVTVRKALELLRRIDKPLDDLQKQLVGHLSAGELTTLSRLLTKARNAAPK